MAGRISREKRGSRRCTQPVSMAAPVTGAKTGGGGVGNLHGRRQQWTAPGCTSSAGHSPENELSSAICSHGAGPGDHYSRQDRERQAPRDVARMWTLKGGRDDPNSEAETSSQTQRPDLWVPRGGKAWDQQVQSPAAGWGGDKHLHSTVPSLWG